MVDENEFFRQATRRISGSLNIETAMGRCMAYLKQHMPVSGMLFGLYEPELNVGRLLAAIWPEKSGKNRAKPSPCPWNGGTG